eukprot:jgi/Ulvmu1/11288/UM074_0003.1
MDHALVFDPETMVRSGGLPFVMDKSRPSRIGLLRRAAPDAAAVWFDVEPFSCFHTATAWDDADTVHLVLCKQRDFDINLKATDASGAPQAQPSFAVRLSIDTLTGETCETVLTEDWSLDFPTVPAASIGRSTPYAYMGGTPIGKTSTDLVSILMSAVVKIDLAAEEGNGVVAVIEHAAGLVGGEFSFVPRRGAVDADDGYLVGYATHATTLLSYCLVYDAKTMASTPVAKVQLPQRVPAGFHGLWVSQAQLAQQPPAPAETA